MTSFTPDTPARLALVTGASSGIGRAFAMRLGAGPLKASMPETLMITPSPLATMRGAAACASIVGATTFTCRSSLALSAGSWVNGM
jgi:hypothetical protein